MKGGILVKVSGRDPTEKVCIMLLMRQNIARLIAFAGVMLILAACTSVPVTNRTGLSNAQRLERQSQQFTQGKALFMSKQYKAAAELLLPLARQGHVAAQYTIGYMYHYGYGVPHNEKESTRWIAIAAARGYPQAKEALERINAAHDQQGVLVSPAPKP